MKSKKNQKHTKADSSTKEQVDTVDIEGEVTAPDNVEPETEDEIGQVRLELDEYKNLYLRKSAEFENFKKRKRQEFEALIQSAEESLIASLLPVLDDLDRVSVNGEADNESLLQGIQLIREKLWNILAARGLAPIEAVGNPFNPELHEAIMQQEEEGQEADIVLQEHERGFKLGDRVIRHTKVVVSS